MQDACNHAITLATLSYLNVIHHNVLLERCVDCCKLHYEQAALLVVGQLVDEACAIALESMQAI